MGLGVDRRADSLGVRGDRGQHDDRCASCLGVARRPPVPTIYIGKARLRTVFESCARSIPSREYSRAVPEVGVRARQERRHLGHEFLADVLRGAEPVLVEVAVEPTLVLRGVRQFVQRSLVEPHRLVELLASREQDLVAPAAVARVVAPPDVDPRRPGCAGACLHRWPRPPRAVRCSRTGTRSIPVGTSCTCTRASSSAARARTASRRSPGRGRRRSAPLLALRPRCA